jgi:hypothetical protein
MSFAPFVPFCGKSIFAETAKRHSMFENLFVASRLRGKVFRCNC